MPKKGYATFLLAFLLSLLLLLPIFQFSKPQNNSIAPALIYSQTFGEHLAQKRSIEPATKDAYAQIKPALSAADAAKTAQFTLLSTPIKITSSQISEKTKSQIIKTAIISKWLWLQKTWGSNSDYNFGISCTPAQTQYNLPDFAQNLQIPPAFYSGCQSKIQIITDAKNNTKIKILRGVHIKTTHKITGATSQSPLQEFEVS